MVPGEGNGAASRMADVGSSGGEGQRGDSYAGGLPYAGSSGSGNGVVNVCGLSLMVLVQRLAHRQGRQGAAWLLTLKHRPLAVSAGDSGK